MSYRSYALKAIFGLWVLVATTGAAASLRFGGIYRHREPSWDYATYLRFYAHGTALSVSSTGNPDQIIRWFNRGPKAPESGHYTVRGNRVRFTTFGVESSRDCSGTVQDATIILQCQGSPSRYRFDFLRMHLAR
jgi:hypothetical protein